jgi:hypothetical protein
MYLSPQRILTDHIKMEPDVALNENTSRPQQRCLIFDAIQTRHVDQASGTVWIAPARWHDGPADEIHPQGQ